MSLASKTLETLTKRMIHSIIPDSAYSGKVGQDETLFAEGHLGKLPENLGYEMTLSL